MFTWGVDDTPAFGSIAVVHYGFSNQFGYFYGTGHELPWDMSTVGAPQCDLLVDPAISGLGTIYPVQPPGQGPALRTDLLIPPIAGLQGLTFYGQWAIYSPGANALNWVQSNGLAITIG